MAGAFGDRRAWEWVRRTALLLGAAVCGLIVASCGDRPTAAVAHHLHSGNASLSVAPTFAPLPPGAPSIQLSKISGVLVGPDGDSIVVTAKFDGDSAILVFDVQVTGNATDFTLELTAFDMNDVVAYQSTQSVTVKPGDNAGLPAPVLVYAAPDAKIQTLHVSPPSVVLQAGGAASFSATGAGADGQTIPPIRLGWTTHDGSVTTVDDNGNVRAGSFQGSTWIVARTANNIADSAVVSVHAPVDHITASATSLQIVHGASSSVTAQLFDAGNHLIDDRSASWSTSDASVATVSSTGAVQGVKVGTATLTATAEGKSATVAVSVVSAVDHIDLTPSSLTFATLGQSQTVSAHVVARAGASVDGIVASFSSSNPFIATVSSDGKVTSMSDGSATITATADGVTATTSVTVKQVPTSITVSPAAGSVTALGDAFDFHATAYDAGGNAMPTAIVTWSTSDSKVAPIDSDGRVIAGKAGSATITATDGPVSGSASFTASQTPKSMTVSADKSTFMVTQTATLTAHELDANDNPVPLVKPVWSTTTSSIATVSTDGVVTGVAVGTAHLIATADGLTASINLSVTSLPAVTLVLNATAVNVLPSGTAQFSETSGAKGPITWSVRDLGSGNSTVGTVNTTSGLYTAPATVPSPDTVSVCATQVSPPGHTCATVTMTGAPVLDVASTDVIVGATHQFSVASGGTAPFTWVAHNTVGGDATYGTITSTGLYTAPMNVPSPTTIDVCVTQPAPAAQACARVTVKPIATTTLVLNATTAALRTGAATTFAVLSGGTGPFTWTVNNIAGGNSTVGTVDASGLYMAPATAPSSTVSVCASQVSPSGNGCVTVTVTAPPTLDVTTLSIYTSATHQFVASGGSGTFTWTVNNVTSGNSTYGTISASGLYTAPSNVPSSPTVQVCVAQSVPLASTCASVTIAASTVTLTLNVTSIEKLPSGTQSFTVSGGTGPYTWKVNDITNGNSTFGTISASGSTATYTAPAATPSPATFNICVSQTGPPTGSVCASATIDAIPTSGGEIVVFNDENMFDDSYGSPYANNIQFYKNLVDFTASGARASQTGVMMDRSHSSRCGTSECSESEQTGFRTTLTNAGYTITDVDDVSATISSIPASIKVIFLWLPKVAYTNSEINVLKTFASQGGRIIFIGEHQVYYGTDGIAVENAFFTSMGAQMTNQGGDVDPGHTDLPASSLRSHQITTGLTGLAIADASTIIPGPNDYPLFYDLGGTVVLGAVAKVDLTPLSTDRAPRVVPRFPSAAVKSVAPGTQPTGSGMAPVKPPK